MRVGLGSGTTAIEAVRCLGELYGRQELTRVLIVVTSFETEIECHKQMIPVLTLSDPRIDGHLDLAIDGADEVDPEWNLVKGKWGAMLAEKIAAAAADRFAIIVDGTKLVTRLGEKCPVPVEIVPEALRTVTKRLESMGGNVTLRMAQMKGGPVISDHGNFILDVRMDIPEPARLERDIKNIPGVVESGIFAGMATELLIGHPDGRVEYRTRPSR